MAELPLVEKTNVLDVYSKIASDFSRTRYKVWISVENFINQFPKNTQFLEIGCGNGKNMLRPENFMGCDNCQQFVDICKQKNLNVILADAINLPYSSNMFDVTLSIAVLHHLSSIERRTTALKEMFRVTKLGGQLLIEVWCFEDNPRCGNKPDSMISWKYENKTYLRYYHFFTKDDILNLFKKIECCRVDNIVLEKNNWIVYCSKI